MPARSPQSLQTAHPDFGPRAASNHRCVCSCISAAGRRTQQSPARQADHGRLHRCRQETGLSRWLRSHVVVFYSSYLKFCKRSALSALNGCDSRCVFVLSISPRAVTNRASLGRILFEELGSRGHDKDRGIPAFFRMPASLSFESSPCGSLTHLS